MNERVQKVLDEEFDPASLTAVERVELFETESSIAAVVRAVPVEPVPDLAPLVLERLRPRRALPAGRRWGVPNALSWLWRPREVSMSWRPAYGLAAAALVAVLVTAQVLWRGPLPSDNPQVFTQFVLKAPEARAVSLAGDFTDWKPAYVMQRSEDGVWTVVVPLMPGVHTYSFVVDGERWVPDPTAPAVADGFGGMNSRLAVIRPDRRS
jgi:hypothetical protein